MIVDYEDYFCVKNKLMQEGRWDEVHNLEISPESRKLQELKEQVSICEFDIACKMNHGGFFGSMAGS